MIKKWKKFLSGGFLVFIGYLLSPLSWWNDAFVNLPLALAFGWVVALIYKPVFEFAVIFGYWMTNVVGLIMMHKGGQKLLSKEEQKFTAKELLKDILISLGYTALIIILVKLKVLQPLSGYFGMNSP